MLGCPDAPGQGPMRCQQESTQVQGTGSPSPSRGEVPLTCALGSGTVRGTAAKRGPEAPASLQRSSG